MRCLYGVRASKGWSRCDIVILKHEAHFECQMTLKLNQEQTQTVPQNYTFHVVSD